MGDFSTNLDKLVESALLILYGESGTFKTTNLTFGAKHYYAKDGKPVRLISAEDSSKILFMPLIQAGIVQAVWMTRDKEALTHLRWLSRGMWPVNGKWEPYKPGDVSAYLWEGLSSVSEVCLEAVRDSGKLKGEQEKNYFTENNEQFGKSSLFQYGFVQDEVIRALRACASLPGLNRTIWSAHEVKAEDNDMNQIRGPLLVGKAATKIVRKLCGTLLHFESYPLQAGKDQPIQTEVKIWFDEHVDRLMPAITYPAKVTLPPELKEELRTKIFKGGYIKPTLTDGLDRFLAEEERLLGTANTEAVEWKRRIDEEIAKRKST